MTIAIDNRRNWLLIIKSSVSSIVMNLKSKSHSKDVANQTAVRLLDTYRSTDELNKSIYQW